MKTFSLSDVRVLHTRLNLREMLGRSGFYTAAFDIDIRLRAFLEGADQITAI